MFHRYFDILCERYITYTNENDNKMIKVIIQKQLLLITVLTYNDDNGTVPTVSSVLQGYHESSLNLFDRLQ